MPQSYNGWPQRNTFIRITNYTCVVHAYNDKAPQKLRVDLHRHRNGGAYRESVGKGGGNTEPQLTTTIYCEIIMIVKILVTRRRHWLTMRGQLMSSGSHPTPQAKTTSAGLALHRRCADVTAATCRDRQRRTSSDEDLANCGRGGFELARPIPPALPRNRGGLIRRVWCRYRTSRRSRNAGGFPGNTTPRDGWILWEGDDHQPTRSW